jgi:hypothetical protein
MGNGEWGMGNGEWGVGMGNGNWGMGNGEWGMEIVTPHSPLPKNATSLVLLICFHLWSSNCDEQPPRID